MLQSEVKMLGSETVLTGRVLQVVEKKDCIDTLTLSEILNEPHQKVIGATKSIESVGGILEIEQLSRSIWSLTEEGKTILEHGSYEVLLFDSIPEEGIDQKKLLASSPNSKIGFSKAMSYGWISYDKTTNIVSRRENVVQDLLRGDLKKIEAGGATEIAENVKKEYKKRKLIQETIQKYLVLRKGNEFRTSVTKYVQDLTLENLSNGEWKTAVFKPYNFNTYGQEPTNGNLHPLMKVKSEFRQIFLEMGFTEMPTNNFVENSFWNFDALFQPQQHPARDAHDTFFLEDPVSSNDMPCNYVEKVKEVHSKGGRGSRGYKYEWSILEAEKNILRTHTTAVSARMLYKLANNPSGFVPAKYFSIDRVFRNETLDATHLAEFHQVEGVVVGYNLSLAKLIGIIHEFFSKLGMDKIKFKPAYNPYTEPSMEIFCYHKGLDKWIEVGNSGMFRPEMLLPMGFPKKVRALAWGLSLERPTMIKYGISNIRDLVGHKMNMQTIIEAPICNIAKLNQ